jgi:hypothetical protein
VNAAFRASVNLGLRRPGAGFEEIEVAPIVCLLHVLTIAITGLPV